MSRILNYGQPINWANPLTRNLIARFKALPWYASGRHLIELTKFSGNGVFGSGSLSPSWAADLSRPGGLGKCLKFTGGGADNRITVPRNPLLDFNDEIFTISFWMRTPSTTTAYVLEKGIVGNTGWGVYKQANGQVQLGVQGSGVFASLVNNIYTINQWTHVMFTGSGFSSTYKQFSGTPPGLFAERDSETSALNNTNTTSSMKIGVDDGDSFDFDGLLDDICLWNRTLSPQECLRVHLAQRQFYDPTLSWTPLRAYSFSTGGDVVVSPSPVVSTASIVAPSITLLQAGTPVVAVSGVVAPLTLLSQAGIPVSSAASVVLPSTLLSTTVNPATTLSGLPAHTVTLLVAGEPVLTVGTIPVPTTSGQITETPSPVIVSAAVATPVVVLTQLPDPVVATVFTSNQMGHMGLATSLEVAPAPLVVTSSVVAPGTVLGQGVTPAIGTVSVTTPTITIVAGPSPIASLTVVAAPATSLSQVPSPVSTLVTIPPVVVSEGSTVTPSPVVTVGSVLTPLTILVVTPAPVTVTVTVPSVTVSLTGQFARVQVRQVPTRIRSQPVPHRIRSMEVQYQ